MWNEQLLRKTEIGQFQCGCLAAYEQVVRLNVPVNYSVLVNMA